MTTENQVHEDFYWEIMEKYAEENPDCPIFRKEFTHEESVKAIDDYCFNWMCNPDRENHPHHAHYQQIWWKSWYVFQARDKAKEAMKNIFSDVKDLEKSVEITDFFIKENLLKDD